MTEVKRRVAAIEKKLAEIESGQELQTLRIIWVNSEAGEKPEPLEPGTLIIYWGEDDNIGSYRYNPNKPNGGRPTPKNAGKTEL